MRESAREDRVGALMRNAFRRAAIARVDMGLPAGLLDLLLDLFHIMVPNCRAFSSGLCTGDFCKPISPI